MPGENPAQQRGAAEESQGAGHQEERADALGQAGRALSVMTWARSRPAA